MTWYSLLSYLPPATAGNGSNGDVGGNWTDVGSTWRLANLGGGTADNAIQTSSSSSTPWTNAQLVRKAVNEATQNTRVRLRWQISAGGLGSAPFVVLRYVPNITDSAANCLVVKTAQFITVNSGSLGTVVSGTGAITTGNWYDTEVVALTNGSNTTLTEQTWNVTNHITDAFASGTSVASNSYSTPTFNTVSGGVGVFSYQPGTLNVQQFQSFTDIAASAITLSPASASASAASPVTFTIGVNGAQNGGAVALSDGGAGGTFSPASVSLPAGVGASQTFTYAAGAASAGTSVTITASSSALIGTALAATATMNVSSAPASALVISPATQSVLPGSTSNAFTVSANGALTSSVSVSLSDGGAGGSFSPSNLTLTPGSANGSLTYTTGSSALGTINLSAATAGLSSGSATVAITRPTGLLTPASASVVLSPYNWVTDLPNSILAGNTAARCWNPGTYLRAYVTGCTSVSVIFGASTPSAYFTYQVDDGVPAVAVACLNNGSYAITLPDTGTHVVTWMLCSIPQTAGRWAGTNSVVINGIQPGSGGSAAPAITGARRLLIYGDSIAEGIQSRDGADCICTSFAFHFGEAFRRQGWEYGIKAAGASGYSVPVASNLGGQPPAWTAGNDTMSSWNKVDGSGAAGTALTTGAVGGTTERFTVPSDLIVAAWGTNDGLQSAADTTVQATVTGLAQRLRVAAPTTVIVMSVPFGGYKRSAIQAAAAAAADPRLILVDPKTDQRMTQSGYCGNLVTGAAGSQNIHPWSVGSAILGNYLVGLVGTAFVPFATARAFGSAS